MFDAVLILIVVGCVAWGYWRGGLGAVLSLVALVLAYVLSAPLGPVVARLVMPQAGWAQVAGRIVAGVVIYVPLVILGAKLEHKLGRTEEGRPWLWNRFLGVITGLAWGLVLALSLAWVADVAVRVYPEASGWPARAAQGSGIRRLASSLNPANRLLVTDSLRLLRAAEEDPGVWDRLAKKDAVRRVLGHPALKPLLDDEELLVAVRAGRLDAVWGNENVRRMLKDKELRALLTSPELRAAFEEVLAETPRGRAQRPPSD